ncbi:MAG: LON peptidase substrate-binding domain-containing protein [Pseudomonadota bacterium]
MTDPTDTTLPLFPLRTVLFPEGPLPLRVFEPRYLDMVSRCMRESSGFGVVMIEQGNETGAASFARIGTVAKIVDWYQGSDGILGITAIGEQRFSVTQHGVQNDGLNTASVELLGEPPSLPLPSGYSHLAEILKSVLDDFGRLYADSEKRYDDAAWVSYRLAEILPISAEDKQRCLEAESTEVRLGMVGELVQSIRPGP